MKKIYFVLLGSVLLLSGFMITSTAQEQSIPKWIKGVAKFWVEGEVNDQEFIQALQWMIDNGILQVNPQTELEKQLEQQILENMLKKQNETPPLIGVGFECVSPYERDELDFTVEVINHDTKPHSPIIEIQSTDEYERSIYTSLIDVGKLEPKQIKTVVGTVKDSSVAGYCNAVVKEIN